MTDKEYKNTATTASAKWNQKNKERVKLYVAKYRETNRALCNARSLECYHKKKDEINARRRARRILAKIDNDINNDPN